MPDEKGAEFDKLANFTTGVFENIDMHMHKEQFPNTGTIKK